MRSAEARPTTEGTLRQQALAVCRRSGLRSRAELSAVFLADLLLPVAERMVVHFAIALLVVGVLLRALSLLGRPAFLGQAAATLIALGTVGAFAAVLTGQAAHDPVEQMPGLRAAAEHGGAIVYNCAGGVGTRSGDPGDVKRLLLAGCTNRRLLNERPAGRSKLLPCSMRQPALPGRCGGPLVARGVGNANSTSTGGPRRAPWGRRCARFRFRLATCLPALRIEGSPTRVVCPIDTALLSRRRAVMA